MTNSAAFEIPVGDEVDGGAGREYGAGDDEGDEKDEKGSAAVSPAVLWAESAAKRVARGMRAMVEA